MRYLVLAPNLGLWYPKGSCLSSLNIRMQIMPDVKLIEKVSLGLANFLVDSLSFGPQRNKILLPYPWPKRSMLPRVVVVHNYYGCVKLLRTMITL
jgi:hypothetical protein